MLTTMICLFLLILPGTPTPQAPLHQPAVAPLQPAQEQYKRPIEVLMGSLTKYSVGVYWKGPNWAKTSDQDIRDEMKKNTAKINVLVKAGKLVGMAAVSGESDCKMVVFFKTESEEEARAIAESSYAVKQGLLKEEIYQVWGTRGMGEGLKESLQQDPSKKANKESFYLAILSKGKKWTEKPEGDVSRLMDEHASKVMLFRDKGVLRFYGAVSGNTAIRNISIVKGESASAVEEKLAAGNLMKMKWFSAEVYPCTLPEGTLP
jgi:hypothetical protein